MLLLSLSCCQFPRFRSPDEENADAASGEISTAGEQRRERLGLTQTEV